MSQFFPPSSGAEGVHVEHGRTSDCVNAQNPFGHNPECLCSWLERARASQVIPYLHGYPESPHAAL